VAAVAECNGAWAMSFRARHITCGRKRAMIVAPLPDWSDCHVRTVLSRARVGRPHPGVLAGRGDRALCQRLERTRLCDEQRDASRAGVAAVRRLRRTTQRHLFRRPTGAGRGVRAGAARQPWPASREPRPSCAMAAPCRHAANTDQTTAAPSAAGQSPVCAHR